MIENLALLRKFKKKYPKGNIIVYEYDEGEEIYYISKGKVKVSKISNLQEKVIAYLREGEFFGEMAILGDCKRSATVSALEDVEALVLKKEDFFYLMKLEPKIMINMIKELSKRYISTEAQLNNNINQDIENKVLRYINTKYKEKTDHDLPLVLEIKEISDIIDVKISELLELLEEYRKQGYLKYDTENVYIEFLAWVKLNMKKTKL